jgi:hypothetical protein
MGWKGQGRGKTGNGYRKKGVARGSDKKTGREKRHRQDTTSPNHGFSHLQTSSLSLARNLHQSPILVL